MIKSSLFMLPVAAFIMTNTASAQQIAQCEGPLISMEGAGEVESVPDIAEVMLNVKSESKTEGEALQDLSENLQKIVDVLEDLNIKDEHIRTDSININPVYNPRNRQEIIAYSGTSRVYFKTFDLKKISDLMNGVMAGSDNLFSNITYSSSDAENLEDKAREKAFKKAHHKAKLYAELSGNKLGQICTISENQIFTNIQPFAINRRSDMMAMESAPAMKGGLNIPIKPGLMKTSARVSVVYQLEK
ncbi:SIMPL domain-containing protein [Pseudemcibacter aquimaris]|uniref:SIMPL domain-containing protein n=1 Tax=Pseudemcibacter aquimaris TaxID=2857064 RepID=UPI002010D6B1|nr:SIMPL domain-containing protein [Pseudemcibacter aquimaris]MCC3861341.1 SIMPL domain-containing protein [Pseudemcibacter aquimaris]WDU58113.1 SIMPL domain-containing protein [Pseudemcibacter aquimaris]